MWYLTLNSRERRGGKYHLHFLCWVSRSLGNEDEQISGYILIALGLPQSHFRWSGFPYLIFGSAIEKQHSRADLLAKHWDVVANLSRDCYFYEYDRCRHRGGRQQAEQNTRKDRSSCTLAFSLGVFLQLLAQKNTVYVCS